MEQHEAFSRQAAACGTLGSPMYAELLTRAAADLREGGAVARVLAGHEEDPGPSALALRLLGSVHRLVLTSDAGLSARQPALTGSRTDNSVAGELAAYYPSVGGTWSVEGGWEAFLALLTERPDEVREWLDRPPQTNEVGRAGALMGGLLQVGESFGHPVRLFEIGSSGGLNLLADRFAYVDDHGTTFGDPAAPVRLDRAWQGRALTPWPELRIVERVGSDPMPVDARTTQGRLVLTAYVWPDQAHRLERLRGVLDLARHTPLDVRREGAARFVDSLDLRSGATTVLWHSVMWQYLDRTEQDAVTSRIQDLGARASEDAPFAHLFLEPTRRTPDGPHDFLVVLELWPTGERRILGSTVGHGVPTTWE
jgi:hypothetical protein